MKKTTVKIIASIVFVTEIFFGTRAFAINDQLPTMMVGQTTVDLPDGNVAYGGMTGNYAILNFDPDSDLGFDSSDENEVLHLMQPGCLGQTFNGWAATIACFVLGTGRDGSASSPTNKLMTSRTTIDQGSGAQIVYELPTLYFGGVNVVGDAFTPDMDNFSFWGRNLAQNPDSDSTGSGATWKLGNYQLNPEAQSSWPGVNSDYLANLSTLAGQAQRITDLTTELTGNFSWYLQGSNLQDNEQSDMTKYPEGKVWLVDSNDLVFSDKSGPTVFKYHGKGTIIIKGRNLIVGKNVQIEPAGEDDKLGIITLK